MKVLTIEPTGNCRLQEDLALLADCALPAELRVGSIYPTSGLSGAVVCVHMCSVSFSPFEFNARLFAGVNAPSWFCKCWSILLLGNAVKVFNEAVSAGPFTWISPPAGILVNETLAMHLVGISPLTTMGQELPPQLFFFPPTTLLEYQQYFISGHCYPRGRIDGRCLAGLTCWELTPCSFKPCFQTLKYVQQKWVLPKQI